MQGKDTIPYQHWSLKVGRADAVADATAAPLGEIVWGIGDLEQAITSLILTPIGSVPTEPEKGCDLMPYVDRPYEIAAPGVTRAIWDALTIWEPRIVLQDVQVVDTSFSTMTAKVFWRPVESVLDDLLVTEVSLSGEERRVA